VNRLLRGPDSKIAYESQNKSFQDDRTFSAGGKAYVKDFQFDQKVQLKAFYSKEFAGSRNFWAGDFQISKYAAADPQQRRFIIPNASKTFETASVDVKDARESGKAVPIDKYQGNLQFKGRYEDQTNLATDRKAKGKGSAEEKKAAAPPMTIDEVRNLLNKNK
jgi:hypothetical protein